jgi:ornithine--oxo-acid transaminase
MTTATDTWIALAEQHTAHNYHPLPVVVAEASGAWVTDVEGRRYLDCLAGYSALNFGHGHPDLLAAAHRQLDRVTLTSRAFHHDQLGPFCADLAALAATDLVLPMNTGAEAVESAIKVSRKWGYQVKGVPDGQATIVVADGNFHGRTTTIISFSTDPQARDDFGPYTPGFRIVPYGDADALAAAIDDSTVAVLLEPIQGEAGVLVPPPGYLSAARVLCTERNVLLVLDEIQSGLGRTGETFAWQQEGAKPDLMLLGKALGGGIVPVSAVVGREAVLGVLHPGEHGSTFGGNPLATAAANAVLGEIERAGLIDTVVAKGERIRAGVLAAKSPLVGELRGAGLLIGVGLTQPIAGRVAKEALALGLIVNAANDTSIRIAPPLIVTDEQIDEFTAKFTKALEASV